MSDTPRDLHPTELLGYITGGLAHDLNNYLSPILLGVQTLQRNDPDEKTKRILSMIELSSRRAADLIRHLLDYSRSTRAHEQWMPISEIENLIHQLCNDKNEGTFDVHMTAPHGHRVHCESVVLKTMLGALLDNACDASGEQPRIRISVTELTVDDEYKRSHRSARNGTYACITISDSGCGMSEDLVKHACEPFYTTRRETGHAGLGLYVVHTMLKHYEGFMEIDSTPGQGTTITMCLPRSSS